MSLQKRIQLRGLEAAIKSLDPERLTAALEIGIDAVGAESNYGLMRRTVVTGRLRSSWEKPQKRGRLTVILRNRVIYAAFVDQGTKPHFIAPRYKKALRWYSGYTPSGLPAKGARPIFAKRVHHPGFAGRQMVARTLAEDRSKVIRLVSDAIKQRFL